MKTLGIVGGLGPESTVDYYQRIIALYRERTGDGSYPEFIINSIDLKTGLDFMDANELAAMADYLLQAIGRLARAGADFGLISANTPHIVFEDVASKSPIPLISIVEATCASAKTQNLNTARFARDAVHHAGQLLSESFLARKHRASRAFAG
jgi:aspartate racemase